MSLCCAISSFYSILMSFGKWWHKCVLFCVLLFTDSKEVSIIDKASFKEKLLLSRSTGNVIFWMTIHHSLLFWGMLIVAFLCSSLSMRNEFHLFYCPWNNVCVLFNFSEPHVVQSLITKNLNYCSTLSFFTNRYCSTLGLLYGYNCVVPQILVDVTTFQLLICSWASVVLSHHFLQTWWHLINVYDSLPFFSPDCSLMIFQMSNSREVSKMDFHQKMFLSRSAWNVMLWMAIHCSFLFEGMLEKVNSPLIVL